MGKFFSCVPTIAEITKNDWSVVVLMLQFHITRIIFLGDCF